MTARRIALVLFVAVVAVPATAFGWSAKLHTVAPTKAQRAAILTAFGYPKAAWPCMFVGLAASNHNYGTVLVHRKTSCQRSWGFDGRNILKRRKDNPKRWKVVFEGSDYQCPLPRIPKAVQSDLGVCT